MESCLRTSMENESVELGEVVMLCNIKETEIACDV